MQRDFIPINENGMDVLEYLTEDFPCAIFFTDIANYALGYVPWRTFLYRQMTAPIFDNAGLATYIFSNTSTWKNEIILSIKEVHSLLLASFFVKNSLSVKIFHIFGD